MPSSGQILAPTDQLKIIVNFNPRLISVIMLVFSFSRSKTSSAKEKIAFIVSFYFIHSAKFFSYLEKAARVNFQVRFSSLEFFICATPKSRNSIL